MSDLDKFLEERSKIPIPSGDVARVKLLAKELALGVHRDLWPFTFRSIPFTRERISPGEELREYFEIRWGTFLPGNNLQLLIGQGYIDDNFSPEGHRYYQLNRNAFDLLEETEPYNVFISYRRLDSSALAVLVLARLKEHGINAFLDIALEAGGNWHADLEERIKACDYFIILLGHQTLASDMTAKEICWGIDSERTIIPFWHGEFGKEEEFDLSQYIVKLAANWNDKNLVSRIGDVRDVIQQTNAIRVTDESASGYNTAIVELLNRFGVTP